MSVVDPIIAANIARESGVPFLRARVEREGFDTVITLPLERMSVTVGRIGDCDVRLSGDQQASRHHATLEVAHNAWYVRDARSTNGTRVNGDECTGPVRMRDGDEICFGATCFIYHDPRKPTTVTLGDPDLRPTERKPSEHVELTRGQRRILRELCRPLYADRGAQPATNPAIANALNLELTTIKGAMNQLFKEFRMEDYGQIDKRVRLARRALESGRIGPRDYLMD